MSIDVLSPSVGRQRDEDRVLIHVDTEEGRQLVNSRMAYVAVSRGRAQIFTNDRQETNGTSTREQRRKFLGAPLPRAIVSGHVDDVKTEYSEAPLPLDPALAEVIFEWKRKTQFAADLDFVFAPPFMGGKKPYTTWNMQCRHLKPAAIAAGLGPIGWHTLRHTYRAWLGDNGEPVTIQKELMRLASIHTTLDTYGGGLMESMRQAHGRIVSKRLHVNGRQWTSANH